MFGASQPTCWSGFNWWRSGVRKPQTHTCAAICQNIQATRIMKTEISVKCQERIAYVYFPKRCRRTFNYCCIKSLLSLSCQESGCGISTHSLFWQANLNRGEIWFFFSTYQRQEASFSTYMCFLADKRQIVPAFLDTKSTESAPTQNTSLLVVRMSSIESYAGIGWVSIQMYCKF